MSTARRTYETGQEPRGSHPWFRCLKPGCDAARRKLKSFNPNDVENAYCVGCDSMHPRHPYLPERTQEGATTVWLELGSDKFECSLPDAQAHLQHFGGGVIRSEPGGPVLAAKGGKWRVASNE